MATTQAQLDEVNAAITRILTGAQEIGQGSQRVVQARLETLMAERQRLEDKLASESDEEFERWATDEADVEGKLSLYDMKRLAFGEMVETGDCLILTCQSDDRRRRVPLFYQLKLIEREQFDASKDRPRVGVPQKAGRR